MAGHRHRRNTGSKERRYDAIMAFHQDKPSVTVVLTLTLKMFLSYDSSISSETIYCEVVSGAQFYLSFFLMLFFPSILTLLYSIAFASYYHF